MLNWNTIRGILEQSLEVGIMETIANGKAAGVQVAKTTAEQLMINSVASSLTAAQTAATQPTAATAAPTDSNK